MTREWLRVVCGINKTTLSGLWSLHTQSGSPLPCLRRALVVLPTCGALRTLTRHPDTARHDYALTSRVTSCMVELDSSLAKRYPLMPVHDLPAAISKLRPTSKLLKPRDGVSPGWQSNFDDLLSIHSLTDYKRLPPPTQDTFLLMHDDKNDAIRAHQAALLDYQYWNTLLYHLLAMCVDLKGPYERIDTHHIASTFCVVGTCEMAAVSTNGAHRSNRPTRLSLNRN